MRAPGQRVATVVAKATYALDHELCALLDEPDPIQSVDDYWDDDESKSVSAPSDLALFKPVSEVVVVGHAYAPKDRPTQSIMVRIAVGPIDKIIETASPRRYTRDGQVEQGAPSHRMSLRYEFAPGGPDTENPVGIDPTVFDEGSQRWRVPQVLPANHMVEPGEYIQRVGVGPISPHWRGRAAVLRAEDRAWLQDPAARPMPAGFDPRYFCVAPPDQRVNDPFRADERILLEGLHPQHSRLVTNLAGIAPVLAGLGPGAPALVADTLYIDSDRGVVTLTFRAHVPIEDARSPLRVTVRVGSGAALGRAFSLPPSVPPPAGESTIELARTGGTVADALNTTNDELDPDVARSIVLPFAGGAGRHSVPPPKEDGALPFRSAAGPTSQPRRTPSPPSLPAPAPVPPPPPSFAPPPSAKQRSAPPAPPAVVSTPGPIPPPPPSIPQPRPSTPPSAIAMPALGTSLALVPPGGVSAPLPSPAMAPPPPPPAVLRGQTVGEQHANASLPAVTRDSALRPASPSVGTSPIREPDRDPFQAAFGSGSRGAPASPSRPSEVPAPRASNQGSAGAPGAGGPPLGAALANLVPGGVVQSAKAASDAAADRDRASARRAVDDDRPESTAVRRVLVDLLSVAPDVPRRIRRTKWMAALLSDFVLPRPFRRPDEPEPERDKDREERGRFEVLRVLSCGQPLDSSTLGSALDRALEDPNDLEIPLFLVAGELRPTFDEVETLKAAVRVATPLSTSDKRLAATVAVANEAVSASNSPALETVNALYKQLEGALRELNLPNRYLSENVDRVLLESRAYRKRTVLGEPRIRAELTLGPSAVWPTYLPEGVGTHLPMLPSFGVVALVEVRPREDAAESHAEALVVAALGRVVRSVRR